jgi:amino acid transporter
MFDKHVYTKRQPSFWEDMRMNVIVMFILSIIVPSAFGYGAAAKKGDQAQMAAELHEAKQNSRDFVNVLLLVACFVAIGVILLIAVRMGLLIWLFSMMNTTLQR